MQVNNRCYKFSLVQVGAIGQKLVFQYFIESGTLINAYNTLLSTSMSDLHKDMLIQPNMYLNCQEINSGIMQRHRQDGIKVTLKSFTVDDKEEGDKIGD